MRPLYLSNSVHHQAMGDSYLLPSCIGKHLLHVLQCILHFNVMWHDQFIHRLLVLRLLILLFISLPATTLRILSTSSGLYNPCRFVWHSTEKCVFGYTLLMGLFVGLHAKRGRKISLWWHLYIKKAKKTEIFIVE